MNPHLPSIILRSMLITSIFSLFLIACGSGSGGDDKKFSPNMQIVEKWKHLKMIDIHNHDACCDKAYQRYKQLFDTYYIDKIVLFGDISEPSAINTDEVAWNAYKDNPARIIPFFSGFEMYQPQGLDRVVANIKKGYFGVGETVAASTNSPVASVVAWKAQHPMDGNLPQIYKICADYDVPILLHIDPLSGFSIEKLEEALKAFPTTKFILGHVNAYNSPANLVHLPATYSNLYLDFLPGFTRYNPDSAYSLKDWIPLIKQYPDRFMLSTDSGYGVGHEEALFAMYELIDLINDEAIAKKIARENFLNLIKAKL